MHPNGVILCRRLTQQKCKNLPLGHSNLMFCFTSRIARKSESVGRNIFVNVIINLYTTNHKNIKSHKI